MIGTIDVKINAAHPNLPLAPLFVFVNSPAAPRVLNVPKKIGNWELTKVYASATFPDNTTRTVEMKNVAGCYVGTLPACEATGSSEGGFQITADGRDENGNAVTGYCLGRGDLFVLDRDGQITSAGVRYFFHFVDAVPEHPNKGDTAVIGGTLKWYNGTAWVQFGGLDLSSVTLNLGGSQESINQVLAHIVQAGGGTVIY